MFGEEAIELFNNEGEIEELSIKELLGVHELEKADFEEIESEVLEVRESEVELTEVEGFDSIKKEFETLLLPLHKIKILLLKSIEDLFSLRNLEPIKHSNLSFKSITKNSIKT